MHKGTKLETLRPSFLTEGDGKGNGEGNKIIMGPMEKLEVKH